MINLASNDTYTSHVTEIIITDQPESGLISVNGLGVNGLGVNGLGVNGLGVRFTADDNKVGNSQFSYRIKDSTGLISNISTNTLILIDVNVAPTALDDAIEASYGLNNQLNILNNDEDETLKTVIIHIITAPISGTATVAGQYVRYVNSSISISQDSFTDQITDEHGISSDTATANVL